MPWLFVAFACRVVVRVSCNKPDPADQQPGDPKDCFAYQANDACLPAYDPDGFGYYARIWYSAKVTWATSHNAYLLQESHFSLLVTVTICTTVRFRGPCVLTIVVLWNMNLDTLLAWLTQVFSGMYHM